MKKILLFLLGSIALSCSDDDPATVRVSLNEFEQSIIPFTEDTSVSFTNELDQELTVLVGEKVTSISFSQENEGTIYELEQQRNSYIFNNGMEAEVNVGKTENNISYLNTNFEFTGDNIWDTTVSNSCDPNTNTLENELINITIDGVSYNNVFLLEPFCPNQENSFVTRIIYSIERGMEYIEFEDSTFLKQQ